MIGECDSLAPRKKTLNFVSLFLSMLAGIFMIVACASYSANWKTIQKLSFATTTIGFQIVDPAKAGVTYNYYECGYIGLQGSCAAACGASQTMLVNNQYSGKVNDLPMDSPRRECPTGGSPTFANDGTTITGYASTVQIYKTVQESASLNYCKGSPKDQLVPQQDPGGVTINEKCDVMKTCQDSGNFTMAFAVIGCITALLSVVAFAWRMNSDGLGPKVIAFILAGVTFVVCTTAFGGFQPCARKWYDAEKKGIAATAKANNMKIIEEFAIRPGVGGALAATAFVFFIYVWMMSLFVPSAEPKATNSGIDNKAPQV